MSQLKIGKISIDIVHKEIKNIHLGVYPPYGRVRIAAPLGIPEETIRLFALSRIGWIKKSLQKYHDQQRTTPRVYKQREGHYYQGKRYLLNIIDTHDHRPRIEIKRHKYIDMYLNPDTPAEKRHELMNNWYRQQLKQQIPPLIEKWQQILQVEIAEWHIKIMKTKWGSCNSEKKRIWINLELAKKPGSCLEYILVHEMVHLLERHHNEKFLYYMNRYLPNWRSVKDELNRLPISHADWEY